MDPELEQPTNDEALASMTAGYNKQRGIEPEAPAVTVETPPEPETVVAAEPEVPAAPQQPSVEDRLADLMSHVARVEDTSTKAHGKIGELNRTILQLQQRAAAQPEPQSGEVSAEVLEALKQAEAVAEEFPELAGPLVNVMKALTKRAAPQPATTPAVLAAAAAETPDIDSMVASRVEQLRMQDAIEVLADEHPDWSEVRETPEYKAWLGTKDEAFRTKFLTSKNPLYVSKQLTEFKAWRDVAQAAEQKKRQRLEGALTPEGEGTAGPSKLPDSAGLAAGYNKVRRLRTAA